LWKLKVIAVRLFLFVVVVVVASSWSWSFVYTPTRRLVLLVQLVLVLALADLVAHFCFCAKENDASRQAGRSWTIAPSITHPLQRQPSQ